MRKAQVILKLFALSVGVLCTSLASGAIVSQSETFTGLALMPAGYTFSGGGGLDTAQNKDDPVSTLDIANDGGMFVDGPGVGENVVFDFAGTIANGENYTFDIALFQSSSSFITADIELLVGGVQVATTSVTGINGSVQSGNPAKEVQLLYTAVVADAGKTFSFRATETRAAGGASTDLGIDNWALGVVPVPEPASMVLMGIGGLLMLRRRRAA